MSAILMQGMEVGSVAEMKMKKSTLFRGNSVGSLTQCDLSKFTKQ